MARLVYGAFLAVALGLVSPAMSTADEIQVRELLVDWANTPEEHRAMARYYSDKAKDERREAVRHRDMGGRYAAGKMQGRLEQKQHCDRIADLHSQLADEYEVLGQNHAKAAGDHSGPDDGTSE